MSVCSVSGIGISNSAIRDDNINTEVSPFFVGVGNVHFVLRNQPRNVDSSQILLSAPVVTPSFEVLFDLLVDSSVQFFQPPSNPGKPCQDGRIKYGIVV